MSAALSAGAGRAVIELPAAVFPIDGFDGQHDPLHARVLLLDDGRLRTAIVSLELTSVPDAMVAGLQEVVGAATGAHAADVLVVATHTFSAPHPVPASRLPPGQEDQQRLLAASLERAVRVAAVDATRTRRVARAGAGSGTADVSVNRDVETRSGWWLGTNDSGISDRSAQVVRIDDEAGRPIAVLLGFAVQSSVMNESVSADGRRLVSADLGGAASRHVEQELADGVVALFLPGAAGDQAPQLVAHRTVLDRDREPRRTDVHDAGFLLVELLGERLGAEAVRVASTIVTAEAELALDRGAVTVPGQVPPAGFRDVRPSTAYRFRPAPDEAIPFWLLRVGRSVLVGVRPELSAVTGLAIKAGSPFEHTLPVTMTNGAAKYLPDASAYDRITYEAMSSRYARGAAELVADRILEALARTGSPASGTGPVA